MSFYAGSDRIHLTDTNGAIVFDTDQDIPHILGVYEVQVNKVFYEKYYTEEYVTLATLPDDCDFIICRASCVPFNLEGLPFNPASPSTSGLTGGARGYGAYEVVPGDMLADFQDWVITASEGGSFFQGSLPLEMGQTMVLMGGAYSASQYARRIMHVYVEKDWGNKLVCMFQQSVKSGYGAVLSSVLDDGNEIWATDMYWGQARVGWGDSRKPMNQRLYVYRDRSLSRYGNPMNWVYDRFVSKDDWGDNSYTPNVTYYRPSTPTFGPAGVRWEIKLKIWAGKFRTIA